MECSGTCKNCKKRTLVPDDVTGNLVCSSCGVVQDFENFQAHIGGITGEIGTFVRVGTVGTGRIYNYKEHKIYEAQKLIDNFAYQLSLSAQKSSEVKLLVEKITEGEYGQGNWFPVFVGACNYVVMRKDHKTLPMVQVANLVGCDVYELGRMIGRVVDFTDLKLPEFDIVNSFERAVRICTSFSNIPGGVIETILKQGVFLVQCLIKWFITTGRRPMPVVAAVLFFIGELNQIPVKIDDVANELHVAVTTTKQRYKELLERLVKVARFLPWGKDVTVKNILKNAPFVFQYMEMKSMKKAEGFDNALCDIEALVGDCLGKEIVYGFDISPIEGSESGYFEMNISSDSSDKFRVSPESLAMIYSNFLDEVSVVKVSSSTDKRKRRENFDFSACSDWWKGKSDLGKKLLLMQILDKDVGFNDATPPSFDKGRLAKETRREKIKAAKLRISRIMNPSSVVDSDHGNEVCVFEDKKISKKRKKMEVDFDWEDLIIEILLLHSVKEDEIEDGHYNVLLALHVFDYGIARLASGREGKVIAISESC